MSCTLFQIGEKKILDVFEKGKNNSGSNELRIGNMLIIK